MHLRPAIMQAYRIISLTSLLSSYRVTETCFSLESFFLLVRVESEEKTFLPRCSAVYLPYVTHLEVAVF